MEQHSKIVDSAEVRGCSIITSHLGVGSSHKDRPTSKLRLHVFSDSERDARGEGVGGSKMVIST